MTLGPAEAAWLRDYLLKGGFLWVDDFWGTQEWEQWSSEISRVLPPSEYPIIDLPLDHEVFRTMFNIWEIPQISKHRLLATDGRDLDLRTRVRQRRAPFQGDHRCARPDHGRHDAQHRHSGRVGARG